MGKNRDPGDQQHPPTTQPASPAPSSQPRDPKMQAARVRLPDGVYKEFEVNRSSEGDALFQMVTRDLSIEEREYFSLCFYDKEEGTRHWLYNDKKIIRQLKGLPWEFSFEVKFYPTTPTTLVDDHARYYLFLQLRRDILTERLPATADTHALLGSFVAQMEFGDSPSQIDDDYEKFIVESKLVPASQANPEVYKKIAELHRELRGQTTSEAESLFLDHCKHLALYGIHLFKAVDKEKKATDIGVGAAGINIYQDEKKVHSFNWQDIIKIGYKNSYFTVKLKSGTLGKDEKTLHYKLPTHLASKRAWKCAVEHHTFFRLIQPEDKPQKSFFNFGSHRFRYQGRTQFQTKMASQMFDRPSNVERAPSAMSQPITANEEQKLNTLNLTDSELEQRTFERYRRALTPKSYTRDDDDAISSATFAKYSRPSTLLVVSTSSAASPQQHDLSYSPRGLDDSNLSSAAYYMSERSSLRTPSSAYYPPSEYAASSASAMQSPTSESGGSHYYEGQYRGEYNVQMRQQTGGARRNLFGRASAASRDSVRLVSFHEPIDPDQPIPNTYPVNELPEIPIERIVHVYHEGHYDRLSPRREQRAELPYGFGNYTPRNGVSHVDRLEPHGEMDQQPIRFFVDVRHSGVSRRDPAKRLSHPGKEDVKEKIDPKDYEFAAAASSDPLHRTELTRDVQPANIQQYTRRYHHGDSQRLSEPSTSTPRYRLITHVQPLVVSHQQRDTRNGNQSTSNVNATISQREQVVSTRVRRESPDADRRVRLSASVDRSGNVTDTTEEMTRSSVSRSEVHTSTTTVETKRIKQKIPPSASPSHATRVVEQTEQSSTPSQESRSRYGGFFTKTSKSSKEQVAYDGQMEEISPRNEIEESPLEHHKKPTKSVAVVAGPEKKQKKVKSPKKEKAAEPVEPETREVRLIARVPSEQEDERAAEPAVKEKKPKKEGSTFGFISRSTKTTKTSGYPQSSDHFSGQLDTTDRSRDLESSPFHHGDIPAYSPKKLVAVESPEVPIVQKEKKYRLIARFRHEGDEDEVEKPDAYAFASNFYDGPLDQTSRDGELEHTPIADHANVYHHGESWRIEKPISPVATLEKKQKKEKVKSPKKIAEPVPVVKAQKKQKIVESLEPEIRLIARVRSEPEGEQVAEPAVKEKKPTKEGSKFGFFSRTTKTTKTSGYPETSDAFTGNLDTTDRSRDLESSPFEHATIPAYSPRNVEAYEPTTIQDEKTRYRLVARFRHEGDEDEVEPAKLRPEAYGFASTSYDGPLETTSLERDLEHGNLENYSSVYHHGESWRTAKEPVSSASTAERKEKKVKSKKVKVAEPKETEVVNVKLIARVPPQEEVSTDSTTSSKQAKAKFGIFKSSTKTTTTMYSETKEKLTETARDTSRTQDLENIPLNLGQSSVYTTRVISGADPAVHHEKKRYRLIARFRHEGDEDEVEKPDAYAFDSNLYDGPLDLTSRDGELEHAPIADHSNVYHHGESWRIEKPASPVTTLEKKQKKIKSPKEVAEPVRLVKEKKQKIVESFEPEIRLIARVRTEPEDEQVAEPAVKEKKPTKEGSKFGFFSRSTKTTKTSGYPETSDAFTGDLDTTDRSHDLESSPFEHATVPAYSPKKIIAVETPEVPVVQQEKKKYRLIARFRHEGDEDEVEKPEQYGFETDAYDGPLDSTNRQSELDQQPLGEFASVYHHGDSSKKEDPKPVAVPLVKVKSPTKVKVAEPVEPEIREVRLIARIRSEPEDEQVAEPATKEKKPKSEGSKFGFFSRTTKTTKTSGYPETSDAYTGDLDTTDRRRDLESSPFQHGEFPAYSPKKIVVVESPEVPVVQPEQRKYRLIARFRHEGDEDEVDKPDAYAFASNIYDGPLDQTSRYGELEHTPIADHSNVYHHGESWRIEKPVSPTATLEKKQKKIKSPKKEKVAEPVEPETKEVRLIARVRSEPEDEQAVEPAVKEEKPKKEGSKFGFFSRTTKTTRTSEYPQSSDHFSGELDTTDRTRDLESSPFQHGDIPAYSPKSIVAVGTLEVPVVQQQEKNRYRLIARFRHEGDEDEVEKPASYAFSSSLYDGPLDQTSRDGELEHTPIADHANVYHHGESWRIEKPISPAVTLEKKQKKVKSPTKVKVAEPVESERREVRLIARVRAEPEDEQVVDSAAKEKKPKKEASKFGFLSRTTKTTKTSEYPQPSEHFTGDLDTTDRSHDLESSPFEHSAIQVKKTIVEETPEVPVVQKEKKYRLIARFRHEGDEDEVDKPDAYAFASNLYDGPLDRTSRDGELEHTPIADHANVYHHGESWRIEKPVSPTATLEKKEKKIKSPKKEKVAEPVEPERKEVRLIARVRTEPEDEQAVEPAVKEKKPKKEVSKFGFFSRTTKTTKAIGYPETSEHFTGDLDTTDRSRDLESSPFEHATIPAYSPKKIIAVETPEVPVAQQEKKKYRLIARFRHEGDEDEVEKPEQYGFETDAYDGPLDSTNRQSELDQQPLGEFASVYHHGDSSKKEDPKPVAVPLVKVKSPTKVKVAEPVEPEIREVRLIARIRSEPEDEQVAEPATKEKKPKSEGSKFGFFSRTTKTSGYPETSEHFTGDLDTTDRRRDLESSPFQHGEFPAYSPKKTVVDESPEVPVAQQEKKIYRLIARFRHEGDEDEVEKPDAYAFDSNLYDGPLDQTSRDGELEHTPIADHSNVYHHGESWRIEKPASPVATLEKKQKKIKSPKKEKAAEPVEPETKEVRLIARVRTEPEDEQVAEPAVKEKKPKKEGSKFGFFSRTTKTTKTSGYPEASDAYTGNLDTTDRSRELESSSFEHGNIPAYSPKKIIVEEVPEVPVAQQEKKKYRLIARFRHEGDEDEVEKPDAYAFSSNLYDGPLDQTSRDGELEHAPIADHANVYHHGESWRIEKPASPVATLEKKQKKIKSQKKVKAAEPVEPETREVRLIARVRTEPENEQVAEPAAEEKKPKKEESKFGFFSRSPRTTKTSGYPETSDAFTGDLDTTARSHDLENSPFQHGEFPAYSPKKIIAVETPEVPVGQQEKKKYRLIARFRHEGDEDEVEKPEQYGFETDAYDGPLDSTNRQSELDQQPLGEFASVYHHGDSSKKEDPKPAVLPLVKEVKKVKSPKKEKVAEPVEPERKEIRLIARVRTEPEDEKVAEPAVKEKKPKSDGSKFGFFSRTTKTTKTSGYPETSEHYTGDLDTTDRSNDLESSPFEHGDIPAYSPKSIDVSTPEVPVVQQEEKKYRLIARFRHEGDEDDVEKPDAYAFASNLYDGPLDQTSRDGELEHTPIADHSNVYHHGESWRIEKPASPVATLEKKQKKIKSPKKEKVAEPVEPETKEVRMIARVRSEPEDEQVAEPAVKEQKPKKEGSKFGFFSRTTKTTKTSGYPETSEHFTGDLDTTNRSLELESSPFQHGEIPSYSPKKIVVVETPEVPVVQQEVKRYRLIARFRHEGDEDEVEKPDAYAFSSNLYDGPLDQTSRDGELEHTPIADHANVYHHGESWRIEKPVSPVATLEKKQKKEKSPKKEKVAESVEPERKEVRLIARVRSEPEDEQAVEPAVKEEKPKKEGSKFGFFSRTPKATKTTKKSGYPETSDAFTGDLDTTDRSRDLESSPFEHATIPAYSPKKIIAVETPEVPVGQQEKKKYRLIARFRHEGDEDEVEKPEQYGFGTDAYDGPLDSTNRQSELDQQPLGEFASVYHHGDSSKKEDPRPVVLPLVKDVKKVKSPKKEKAADPVEPETKVVRLIARIRSEPEDEQAVETAVKEKRPKSEGSKFGFFGRSTKTTKTSGYPETSDTFTGDLDTTDRSRDLESSPFEHATIPAKKIVVVETPEVPVAQQEKKRYRLIARFRHEGDEDEVEKPDAYAFASNIYDGPLDLTSRDGELEHTPIADHANVYHHGESWRIEKPASPVATLEKKQKKAKSPKKEKVAEPVEPERKEVRLIARVRSEPEDEQAAESAVKEEKPKKEGSKFGFFSRTPKATKTTKKSGYPETSDAFTGDLDTTDRSHELENTPIEHATFPAYSPKKTIAVETPEVPVAQQEKKIYRLIARFRHEGDEDEVEKPDAYAFSSKLYDGPLDQTARDGELEHAPIADHANVYHHGESWRIEKPASPVATLEKKQKKAKSPKKEKIAEPVEPETKEVRLIARVRSEPEDEQAAEPAAKEKTPKKEGSKFGFFSRTTKTTKTSGYPETSDAFTGDLDTTDRSHDLESSPFQHGEIPAYSPKKIVVEETPEVPIVQQEKKLYRLIARFRHEGDEDEVEKPEAYAFSSNLYDGPLDQTSRDGELEHTPIADHSNVYHHGESWRIEKPASPVATLEKKQKKVKSQKKEKAAEPVEPETREVRLIARVRSEPEDEQAAEPAVKEEKPKKEGSKFGFFSRSKTSKTYIPVQSPREEVTEEFTRTEDLKNVPLDVRSPTNDSEKVEPFTEVSEPVQEEKKRFRWFARFRHEGDEDEVEKPSSYNFAKEIYDGPLDEISRNAEVDQTPINDHSAVYHHGESWRKEKPVSRPVTLEKKETKEDVEPSEIRLIARFKPHETETESAPEEGDSPTKHRSRTASFNIFHRLSKTASYPEASPVYEGPLDVTERSEEVTSSALEHRDYPEYVPKKLEVVQPIVDQRESRIYRLIARFRHEGEEDVVEKPGAYSFASTVYDGPLDEMAKQSEIEQSPITDFSAVYHPGESWRKEAGTPVATLEKKQKKAKKEKSVEPLEPERHEVKLLARVKSDEPEEETLESERVSPRKDDSSKPLRLRFFSLTSKQKLEAYPQSSPTYEGPLDVTGRSDDLEKMPYLHGEVPRYSPKPLPRSTPKSTEKKAGIFARFRHEGDEDVLEKPEGYGFASTTYEGPLDEMYRQGELEQAPIGEHATVYHHGESWRKDDSVPATEKKLKKKVLEKPDKPVTQEVRLIARVPPQEASTSETPVVAEKSPFRFRFFSLSNKGAKTGYPETSPTYEGPLDVTGRSQPLEHVPLEVKEMPAYSPKKIDVETAAVEAPIVEKKRYRLIARFRHEGDEDEVEKPEAYLFSSIVYDGPLEDIRRQEELDQVPIGDHSAVYHHGESWKKVRVSTEIETQPEQENNENVPPRAPRFSFLRGVKPNRSARATSYPSTSVNYTGPLDVTDRNADLEKIPLNQSVIRPKYSSRKPTEADRKYRLIARIRHEGHEDEVEKSDLRPVFYGFPSAAYSGKYETTPLQEEIEDCPIEDFTVVYHHGHSGSRLRHAIMGKLAKEKKSSPAYQEPKADIKLIARVLPMQKNKPERPVSEDEEKLTEPLARSAELEPRAMTDIIGPSTSRNSALVVENTVNYFPSSLQYEPRAARIEGFTGDGHGYVEVRLERRAEVQLEPVYVLRETTRSHAYLSTATTYFSGASSSSAAGETSTTHSVVPFVGSVSEDETGLHFSSTPLNMSPPERPSFLARLGFKRDKSKKKEKKKGKKENESSETSDSEHDEKREFAVVEFQPTHDEKPVEGPKKPEHRTHKSPGRRTDEPMNEVTVVVTGGETRPAELGETMEVRHEVREQQFRLTGDGYTSGFNPNDPSLMSTIQRAERLNASSPRLEHAERTFTVRANAPLPVSFEESGQPYTTVSTWQETSDLPEQVEVYTDENGRQITRTVKSSQVKHTVQTQSFQNFIVDGDQVPVGVVDVERSREQLTPIGQQASSSEANGDAGIVETQTRTMTYEAQGGENAAPPGWAEQGLGEYVSSKSVTQGNRTIETITYKTEKDGIVETHVEHRVTIHSDGDIDHDAELSQAILEATQMNPDMVVEKIEVRQESTQ